MQQIAAELPSPAQVETINGGFKRIHTGFGFTGTPPRLPAND
jgi:hypothetical protein